MTAIVVVVAVLFGFFAAIAVSRFRFKGGGLIILLVLIVQMIPTEALFISQFRMLDGWHLLNHGRRPVAALHRHGRPVHRCGCCAGSSTASRPSSKRRRWSTAAAGSGRSCGSRCRCSDRASSRHRLRVPAGVERIHPGPRRDDEAGQRHPAAVAADVQQRAVGHRLGRHHGGRHADLGARVSSCSSSSRVAWARA